MATNYETFNASDDYMGMDETTAMSNLRASDEPMGKCESCDAIVPEETLAYVGNGWNFLACEACQAGCKQQDAFEILQGAECVECGSSKKTVVSDRLYVNSSAVCCESKVA